jgi:hypothetical protein
MRNIASCKKTLKRLQNQFDLFWTRFGNDCKRLHFLHKISTFCRGFCSFRTRVLLKCSLKAKGTDLSVDAFCESLARIRIGAKLFLLGGKSVMELELLLEPWLARRALAWLA